MKIHGGVIGETDYEERERKTGKKFKLNKKGMRERSDLQKGEEHEGDNRGRKEGKLERK